MDMLLHSGFSLLILQLDGLQTVTLRLLQIPHFTEKHVELCRKATPSITTLKDFLALEADERRTGKTLGARNWGNGREWCKSGDNRIQVIIVRNIGVEHGRGADIKCSMK